MNDAASPEDTAVTIVTQTTVRPDSTDAFETWQTETSQIVATFPGFIKQTMLPPSPPAQDDWVILQRFEDSDCAVGWLRSPKRLERLKLVQPLLTGRADVHVVRGMSNVPAPSPVSAIISTRVKPGCEEAYRQWEQKAAVTQAAARGLQGYRFEPPIAGVQADWLTILRFDTQENLQAWLDSPVRKRILAEAADFTEEFHYRVARSGFDQWFPVTKEGAKPPAVWKQNMIVLLMLFPVVFLFGYLVQVPLLQRRLGIPFVFALLIGNIASVVLLNWLVPWTNKRFLWWLKLHPDDQRIHDAKGAALIAGTLILLAFVFWTMS
ncbi:MAG: antibiotic biosynthesis monooxygenase [Proteobacteria bacterium]|nr:antibiotic biosynthesis monooxygenase [Pseudomonadota bacterium]